MNNVITAFKEHKIFKQNRHWDINTLLFPSDLTTPPHYADTIEVLLCCDVIGDIYINGEKFTLGGKQVFYIPPRVVHSVFYKKSSGYVKVLKINVEHLKSMLNIDELLKYERKDFYCLPASPPCFNELCGIADVFQYSENILEVCQSILQLFYLLAYYAGKSNIITSKNGLNSHNLRKIILWTENNYLRKISLDEAANVVGYEKHYFCNKFKSLTGISYINYVNNLRIQYACLLLENGHSVSSVCDKCNFENLSYFIQLFKKTVGVTPKMYGRSFDDFSGNAGDGAKSL